MKIINRHCVYCGESMSTEFVDKNVPIDSARVRLKCVYCGATSPSVKFQEWMANPDEVLTSINEYLDENGVN